MKEGQYMHLNKKFLIIGVLCVVVLGAALGGFAIANADDTSNKQTTFIDKVAEIYQKDTGNALDAQALQKAFQEAGAALKTDAMDEFLQKLVDNGKITQAQADAFKAWLAARPDKALTDEFKTWMQSRPDIPGLFGQGKGGMMPFGGRHGFGMMGNNRFGMMDNK
jgi:SspJ family small acid-soluble spore protein